MSGTRAVFTLGARSHQSNFAQPKGKSEPFRDFNTSLRLGSVIMKAAPGHTPGHQVLILKLATTGPIMLSGDLYHYPEERSFKRRPPDNEFSPEQSAASRRVIEEYLGKTKIPLWIEHDYEFITKLKKAPAYYD